jgi:hypothetical protein
MLAAHPFPIPTTDPRRWTRAFPQCLGHSRATPIIITSVNYEFKFIPPTQELHEPVVPEPFAVEFNEALKAHNLQGVLGIRSLKTSQGKKAEMEIMKGRSNITTPTQRRMIIPVGVWWSGHACNIELLRLLLLVETRNGGHLRNHQVSARLVIGFSLMLTRFQAYN